MIERREMIHGAPTLGVYFNIDKLNEKYGTASYGLAGWKIIWSSLKIENLKGMTYLFDGDTNKTIYGRERVWCAAFQSDNRENLSYIRTSLEINTHFKDVAAPTIFNEDRYVTGEPLPGSGCIMSEGKWEGDTVYDSYRALKSFLK